MSPTCGRYRGMQDRYGDWVMGIHYDSQKAVNFGITIAGNVFKESKSMVKQFTYVKSMIDVFLRHRELPDRRGSSTRVSSMGKNAAQSKCDYRKASPAVRLTQQ